MKAKKEYETKILGIDIKELDRILISIGAKKQQRKLMKRWALDWQDKDPELVSEWIRLRDEGDKITLTYKNKHAKQETDTEEIEVEVTDFEKTAALLRKIPFKRAFYQENYRTTYKLNNIEFDIDEWPNLEPYIEIEGRTKKDVEKGLEMLGLKGKEIGDVSVNDLYRKKGIILHDIKELKFEDK
jgi:adenylate cyclase, class 2